MKAIKKRGKVYGRSVTSGKFKRKSKKEASRQSSEVENETEEEEDEEDEDLYRQFTIAELMEEDDLHLSDIEPECDLPRSKLRSAITYNASDKDEEVFMFPRERQAAKEKQMETLLSENRELQQQLEQRELAQCALAERALSEVLRLRAQLNRAQKVSAAAAALPGPGPAQGRETAAAQIVELSKRERELSAELATKQNKARAVEAKVLSMRHSLRKTKNEQQSNEARESTCSVSGTGARGSGDSVDSAKKGPTSEEKPTLAQARVQFQRDTQRLQEMNAMNEQLRNEMGVARQVLALEIGDAVAVAAALSGKAGGQGNITSNMGWRARAQQVIALHQRTGDLRQQLKDTMDDVTRLRAMVESAKGGGDAAAAPGNSQETQTENWTWNIGPPVIGPLAGAKAAAAGAAARERRAAAEAAETAARETREAADAAERRLEAARARGRALEVTAASLRRRLEELLEESTGDDRVVATLSGQLRLITERLEKGQKDLEDVSAHIDRERANIQETLQEATMKVSELQACIAEDEAIIQRRMELQVQETGSVIGSCGSLSVFDEAVLYSPTPRSLSPMSRGTSDSGPREAQTKEVLGVADVDCARLLELASVHCGKICEQAAATSRIDDEVCLERRRAAALEAQKMRLETYRRGAKERRALQLRDAADAGDTELLSRLEFLEEENEVLRSGLQRTRLESEDDLRVMAEGLRRRGITKWSTPRLSSRETSDGEQADTELS